MYHMLLSNWCQNTYKSLECCCNYVNASAWGIKCNLKTHVLTDISCDEEKDKDWVRRDSKSGKGHELTYFLLYGMPIGSRYSTIK